LRLYVVKLTAPCSRWNMGLSLNAASLDKDLLYDRSA
jgi:hypothetical protein